MRRKVVTLLVVLAGLGAAACGSSAKGTPTGPSTTNAPGSPTTTVAPASGGYGGGY